MAKWAWKKGMYGLQQPFTIKYPKTGVVFDLTGYTVTLYVFATALLFSLVGVLDADPTTGICYFTPTITEFVTAGKYRFEVECTKVAAVVKTKDYIVENTDTRP